MLFYINHFPTTKLNVVSPHGECIDVISSEISFVISEISFVQYTQDETFKQYRHKHKIR